MPQALLLSVVAILSAAMGASLTAVVMEQPGSPEEPFRRHPAPPTGDRESRLHYGGGERADDRRDFASHADTAIEHDASSERAACLALLTEGERAALKRARRNSGRNAYHNTLQELRREKDFEAAVDHVLARWDEPSETASASRRKKHDTIRGLGQLKQESPRAARELERILRDHASQYDMYGDREHFDLAYSAANARNDAQAVLDLARMAARSGDAALAQRGVRNHLDEVLAAPDAAELLKTLSRPQDLSLELVQSASNLIESGVRNPQTLHTARYQEHWTVRRDRFEKMAVILETSGRDTEAAKVREHLTEFDALVANLR